MYHDKTFINFRFNELRHLMNVSHFLADQQANYILIQNNVIQYTVTMLGSTECVDTPPKSNNLIIFDQLFDELKTVLI
jgi:predicted nucleotidyltransferase